MGGKPQTEALKASPAEEAIRQRFTQTKTMNTGEADQVGKLINGLSKKEVRGVLEAIEEDRSHSWSMKGSAINKDVIRGLLEGALHQVSVNAVPESAPLDPAP